MAAFSICYSMNGRGLTTLLRHKLPTVDASARKSRNYDKLESYLLKYRVDAANSVRIKCRNNAVVSEPPEAIAEQDAFFTVKQNRGKRFHGTKQYTNCEVPLSILDCMKRLFVSTIVYSSEKRKTPVDEAVTFTFDTLSPSGLPTVTISDLSLYEPTDTPYFAYVQNAAATTVRGF